MPSIRNILFLCLTAGIGIGAFLVVRGAPPASGAAQAADTSRMVVQGQTTAVREAPDDAGREELALLDTEQAMVRVGGGIETTVVWPLEVELTLALGRALEIPKDAQPIRSGANARLEGSLRGRNGRPLNATVTFLHGPNAGRVLQTDSSGRFGAGDLWQGLSVVRAVAPSGLQVERELALAQLATQQMHVSFANGSYLSGTVTDMRGKPIGGADVSVDGRLKVTNDDGIFSFAGVPPGKVLATVRKDGYAITRRAFSLGLQKEVLPETFKIQIVESASLQIVIGKRAGASGPSTAILMPAAGPGREILHRGFPWYELNPVEIPPSGRVTVRGLPAESVGVRVFHPGALASKRSSNVRLYGGSTETVEINLVPASTIRGVVMDEGQAIRGANVVIEAANQSVASARGFQMKNPRSSLEMVLPMAPTARDEAQTDGRGRFSFTRDPELLTTYYITATSPDGRRQGIGVVMADTEEVVVRLEPKRDPVGRLEIELPGRFQGLPVKALVKGVPVDPYVLRPGDPLAFEALEEGSWVVRVRWRGVDVVQGVVVEVSGDGGSVAGTLPKGAIEGQSLEERMKASPTR